MKKRTGMIVGLVALICLLALGTAYYTFHWFTSAGENEVNVLEQQAAECFRYDKVHIRETEQRGDYLAALGESSNGDWCICVFERDRLFGNRWRAYGGSCKMEAGTMGGWNYGSPKEEAVLAFGGGDLPEEAHWYTFENGGITYTCPVENGTALDIFVIPNHSDINGYPILLDRSREEMR